MTAAGSSRRHPRGVTLLELVVTLTILAVVGGITLQAFRLGSRSWEAGERRADREQRTRVLAGILGQELGSLFPVTASLGAGPTPAFRGESERIFFHASGTGQGPLPFSAMARSVTYYVRPGEGLVVQEAHPLADDETTFGLRGTPRVIDPDVIRVRFRYLMEKGQMDDAPQWIETWNAEGHLGDTAMTAAGEASALQGADPGGRSDALDELPLAVEVTIVREGASGGRTSNFLFPIHTGRRF